MSYNYILKKYFAIVLSILMISGTGIFFFAQQADAEKRAPSRSEKRAPAPQHKKYLDSRYSHNRSYPVRNQAIRTLPRNHRVAVHGNNRYYSSRGVWYRPYGGRFVVVAPPIGLFLPFLPFTYVTIWANGMPYYYANRVYYRQIAGGYVVVDPPQEVVRQAPYDEEENAMGRRMFIYPRDGQSEEQQADDRYACHQWAVEQTGYDPTQITAEPQNPDIDQQRSDYQRAISACLDSRGYTVR